MNQKKNFTSVDELSVLECLTHVPVNHWNYEWEDDAAPKHLGPVAQDFKAAFYPGRDDKVITTLEFDGVALAAIKGLNQKLEKELKEKDARLHRLEQQVNELRNLVDSLRH